MRALRAVVLLAWVTVSLTLALRQNLQHDYGKALRLSLLFYEAQRSGKLPENNRIPWRHDSALEDQGIHGEDLTGGYYDSGDFVKFSFTMASATTILAWGCISYKDAYVQAGEWNHVLEMLRWATDYFIKCHTSKDELYGQVGDFVEDQKFWGRPEELNMSRPAYKIDKQHPGSDLAGETAAALAAASIVFRDEDINYSRELFVHAKELYDFATTYRGLYNEAIKGGSEFFESTDYGDELTWSAAWLFKASDISYYLDEAEHHYNRFRLKERPNEFSFNRKVAGVQVLLGQLTQRREYLEAAKSFCNFTVYHQNKTPKGLIYIAKEGTLCHAANVAFICLQAADAGLSPNVYRKFAEHQIGYMLGDYGRSFVIGYGENFPTKPYHAASSCPDPPAPCSWANLDFPGPNPQILYGALVSGPNENDYYEDNRRDDVYNEVTLDFNGGFQSSVAALYYLQVFHNFSASVKGAPGSPATTPWGSWSANAPNICLKDSQH